MDIETTLAEPKPTLKTPHRAIHSPEVFTGSWSEADEAAREANAPIFLPITPYSDDRGWSYMNLLGGAMSERGQINFSIQYPGVIKAWHQHDKQSDFWIVLTGHLKVGVYREEDDTAWMTVMGEKKPGVLVIPPPLWHGAACVGPTPAGLLYYMTEQFDRDCPDEHRRPWDSVTGFPWGVENR